MTPQWDGLARPRVKLNTLYLHLQKTLVQVAVNLPPCHYYNQSTWPNNNWKLMLQVYFDTSSPLLLPSFWYNRLKGALSSLKQVLATESPLQMMKNAFYFILKAVLVLEIFKFLSWIFGNIEKGLIYKDNFDFKVHDVTTRLTNNWNKHNNETWTVNRV